LHVTVRSANVFAWFVVCSYHPFFAAKGKGRADAAVSLSHAKMPTMVPRPVLSVLGVLLTPVVLGAAAFVSPRVHVGSSVADLVAFFGATSTSLIALLLLSRGQLPKVASLTLGLASPAIVLTLSLLQADPMFVPAWWACVISAVRVPPVVGFVLVSACLVAFAHALGHWIGSNIEHPGHLLPACVVASIADLVSVLHPSGPSHAVIQSDKALSLLAVSFPVLSTRQVSPTIGVGDLLFIALLLAAARRHDLSWKRMAWALAAGIMVAGAASYFFETAIPALPSIGLAVVLAFGEARKLRARDRRLASIFMVGAAVLAGVLIASRYLTVSHPGP
jgi:hypothetical protein